MRFWAWGVNCLLSGEFGADVGSGSLCAEMIGRGSIVRWVCNFTGWTRRWGEWRRGEKKSSLEAQMVYQTREPSRSAASEDEEASTKQTFIQDELNVWKSDLNVMPWLAFDPKIRPKSDIKLYLSRCLKSSPFKLPYCCGMFCLLSYLIIKGAVSAIFIPHQELAQAQTNHVTLSLASTGAVQCGLAQHV